MVLLPGRALECDPVRPRYVRCDGMRLLLSLPCMLATTRISVYKGDDINIEWRRAFKLAQALALKVVHGLKDFSKTWYHLTHWCQFNWKRRTQYFYAHYVFHILGTLDKTERCIYLFKAPFRWGRLVMAAIDPIYIYDRFRYLDLLEDGTPNVTFSHNLWGWQTPPDPQLYSAEEWHLVTDWEEATFYYDHEYQSCMARHNHLHLVVTEVSTGRTGVVKDVLHPQRQTEWWDPSIQHTKYTVKRSLWRKILPLEYLIQVPDGRTFLTTRKNLTGL